MKIRNLAYAFLLPSVLLLLAPSSGQAQNTSCEAATLEDFFACYGGQNAFSAHTVAALTTFVKADSALQAGDYALAKTWIGNLFNTYPKGSNVWWNVFNAPNGANIGAPHAYYSLRMMEDIADYGLSGIHTGVKAKKANMRVVLVGCSEGIQPTTKAELQNGTGTFVTNTIDPKLKEDDYRIIRQSFDLFSRYVKAITKGELDVNLEFVELNNLCLPVSVTTTQPYLAYGDIGPVWGQLSGALKDSTDWWSIIYPSHVPDFPVFDDESFITGGMGADYKGGPVFISDDKWIVRKPAHLGKGSYSDIERRIYLPQWCQHEFFHHLYRIYPELALEVNGHDWFNLNFWAADFEGQFEADYYAETLHKRLQVNCSPLSARLITRAQNDLGGLYATFSMDELLGPYSLAVIQNQWHEANIIEENGAFFWKNKANVKWKVTPNFATGKLETGSDCPYPGEHFKIELYRTSDGDFLPGAVALKFNSEPYLKRFGLIRDAVPVEIALGAFERVPNLNGEHTGNIVKAAGKFYWQNDAGSNWSLVPDAPNEYFSLQADSPTPSEKFQLILAETGCDLHALGFKYLNHYYWKPKRAASNGSPFVVNGIADLSLTAGFGTHAIPVSEVFEDPEGDPLLLFVTSGDPVLISVDLAAGQLTLSGEQVGSATIYLMALDANGGLAVEEFDVQVSPASSTKNPLSDIFISPRLVKDFVQVQGISADHNITLVSMDRALQQNIPVSGQQMRIDLSHVPAGMYLLLFTDSRNGSTIVQKIMKQ